jgi:hypothetical protein
MEIYFVAILIIQDPQKIPELNFIYTNSVLTGWFLKLVQLVAGGAALPGVNKVFDK